MTDVMMNLRARIACHAQHAVADPPSVLLRASRDRSAIIPKNNYAASSLTCKPDA